MLNIGEKRCAKYAQENKTMLHAQRPSIFMLVWWLDGRSLDHLHKCVVCLHKPVFTI